jgi:hypothetical protein
LWESTTVFRPFGQRTMLDFFIEFLFSFTSSKITITIRHKNVRLSFSTFTEETNIKLCRKWFYLQFVVSSIIKVKTTGKETSTAEKVHFLRWTIFCSFYAKSFFRLRSRDLKEAGQNVLIVFGTSTFHITDTGQSLRPKKLPTTKVG